MASTWDELKFYVHLARQMWNPRYDLHKIPGPKPTPGIGHITAVMRPDYHVQMLDWANEFGGIYRFCLGYQWVVVISDPKLAVQVLGRGAGSVPRKCVGYQFFDLATNHFGAHSFFTTGDEAQWAAVRKACAPAFSSGNVRKSFPIVLRHAISMADAIMEEAVAEQPDEDTTVHRHAGSAHASSGSGSTRSTAVQPTTSKKGSWSWAFPGMGLLAYWRSGSTASSSSTGATVAKGTARVQQDCGTGAYAKLSGAAESGKVSLPPATATTTAATAMPGSASAPEQPATFIEGATGAVMTAATAHADSASAAVQVGSYEQLSRQLAPEGPGGWQSAGGHAGAATASAFDATASGKFATACMEEGADGVPQYVRTATCSIDVQHHLELSLLNVFVEALFDIRPDGFPGMQVAHAMNHVLEEANKRLKVPLSSLWKGRKAQREVRAAQVALGQVYGYLYDVIRSRGEPRATETDLWACLARIRDPRTGKLLTKNQLIPEIGALMMAGFDTSSHSVAWTLFTLAAHPPVQRRVHAELRQHNLLAGPGLAPGALQQDDLLRLPYLNAVIDETMRMFPVAATASVREVTAPVNVGAYKLPPGVIVWPMLYALHNSQRNWDSPTEFKPERWLQPGTEGTGSSSSSSPGSSSAGSGSSTPASGTAPGSRSAGVGGSSKGGKGATAGSGSGAGSSAGSGAAAGKAFMPFSDGMKSCLGQALGLMEVRSVLAVLLSRVWFELDPEMGGAEGVKSNMVMSLTLKMKGGLRLRVHALDPTAAGAARAASGNGESEPATPRSA